MNLGRTMSDWEKAARAVGLEKYADSIHTDRTKDFDLLQASGLPQDNRLSLPYEEFTQNNSVLKKFLEDHIKRGDGFCVRAIPTREGFKQGFTRKYKKGLLDFRGCKEFLDGIIGDNRRLFWVELTNWIPSVYGGVIIANAEEGFVIGEIAKDLAGLTGMEETEIKSGRPLASFNFSMNDPTKFPVRKLYWQRAEDERARGILYEAVRKHVLVGEWDELQIRSGYYEFVFGDSGLRFVDFKLHPMFLK